MQDSNSPTPTTMPKPVKMIYWITVTSYLIALGSFTFGWFNSGKQIWGILFCLPLFMLIPGVISRRRRHYQLIPNLLVIYIGWSLAERLIDNGMQTFAGIAVFFWVTCLIFMLKLIRTPFLIDGGHYVPDPEKKAKRLARKQARADKKQRKNELKENRD